MSVKLKVTKEDGSQEYLGFSTPKVVIDLYDWGMKQVVDIDLVPLGACHDLEQLIIRGNSLKQIDLSPLSSCFNLRELVIHDDRRGSSPIEYIDLLPLARCRNLQKLDLSGNKLRAIDLSSLSSCEDLKVLFLHRNSLNKIDLDPLASCKRLRTISLEANDFGKIDLSPLINCKDLLNLYLGGNPLHPRSGPLEIDLTPLASCDSLRTLDLDHNGLQTIDLTPLGSCDNLESLDLDHNSLQSIDLSPLEKCAGLRTLGLNANQLESIDFSPLSSCHSLETLHLGHNQLKSLDLSPLASCRPYRLYLHYNPVNEVDITPVLMNPSLDEISHTSRKMGDTLLKSWVEDPYPGRRGTKGIDYTLVSETLGTSWERLHKLAGIPQSKSISIQDYILQALGFRDVGIIDSNILEFLRSIPPQTSLEEARDVARPVVVEKICEQIDSGGTTIRLNVEALFPNVAEIAKRVQKIMELRESEILNVRIFVHQTSYAIQKFILTAYGFSFIAASKMLQISWWHRKDKIPLVQEVDFIHINETVKKLGYEIPLIPDEGRYSYYDETMMSKQMRNYILDLAYRESRPVRRS